MTDSYDRRITYLRLSVTELCDLRCRYCMPAEGVCKRAHEEMLSEEEMLLAVEVAASLGVRKVRITGGEPLLKPNLLSLCRRTAATAGIEEVCLTTNGTRLAALAVPLRQAGVRRINISLDTLQPGKYAYMTRRGSLEQVLRGIDAALAAGFDKVKINTVLIGGFNDDEILPLAELTRRYPLDVRFIELMPMTGQEDFAPEAYVPCGEILRRLPDAVPQAQDDGVARLFHLPGALGNIGLISPMTDHFCAWCNRLRLTADGRIKPCLHSAEEFSVKGLDRDGMRKQFQRAILCKPKCRGELSRTHRSQAGRDMNRIGG